MKAQLALIIEDDAHALLLLQQYINQLPLFAVPHIATSGAEALGLLHQNEYDVIFLDMKLPDINGKDLLKGLTKHPAVIVTTASVNYATDCYDLDVADYLVKPFEFTRFLRAINRAISNLKIHENALIGHEAAYLKIGRKMQQFFYHNIDYIEAYGLYSKIWQHGQVVVVNESMATLEEILPNKYFVRIHKSFIINISKITSFDHREIEINQFKIQIGVSYKSRLKSMMDLINKK